MSAENIVIVGAGECGARAAVCLREIGWEGSITLIGEEPLPPYERPPLSKAVLLSNDAIKATIVLDRYKAESLRISELYNTRVLNVDREKQELTLDSGKTLPYFKLLLTTGCQPRRYLLDGVDSSNIFHLRTFNDALLLRKRLQPGLSIVVVGGGFIGLEVAATARQRGCQVTVLENYSRLLARAVPAELAAKIESRHRQEGVDIRLNTTIISANESEGKIQLGLSDNITLRCDLIVAGIGATPNISLAENAGLEIENGIAVSETLKTSDPHIWAAGDCASAPHPLFGKQRRRFEAWRNAQDQAETVARNMLGAEEPYSSIPWFWSDQFELGLHVAGIPGEGSYTVHRSSEDGVNIWFHLDTDGRLVAASGLGGGKSVAKSIKLAERMIASRLVIDPVKLADPAVKLKSLMVTDK
ncbi:NAD(P)/FAD-dependent oxidoreductase [Pantoea agglomerans]|uniref:NAD(P)/FAD-dependent oxidoreductase n=1 Tax=Enterobacter agglomerans TaxID=549 RepID=UPI001303095B|nr:FAD-dependent oxidoreductase [Pantoea agglomerans]